MATSPALEEIEALELARSRLEAALGSDENWRALRRSQTGGDGAGDTAARRARNTRLEMALAGNAHYQAWRHLNGAIDGLRARSAAQAQAGLMPAALPDDVEALLRSDAPRASEAQRGSPRAEARPAPVAAAGPSPPASGRLVQRLERLEGPQAGAKPAAGPDDDKGPRAGGWVRPERKAQPVVPDPPEATVTFVVRETPAPLPPSTELLPDLGAGLGSAPFARLRSLDEEPEPTGATHSPADAANEEAEVTILTADDLRRQREADARAGVVSRFRKALSGD